MKKIKIKLKKKDIVPLHFAIGKLYQLQIQANRRVSPRPFNYKDVYSLANKCGMSDRALGKYFHEITPKAEEQEKQQNETGLDDDILPF